MTIRPPLMKTWVFDLGVYWDTRAETGVFKLQQHDDTENTWEYDFRIIEKRGLPSRIVATSKTAEEIAADWKHITGLTWAP